MEITLTTSDDQNATTWHSLTQIATKNLSANCASGYHMTGTKVSRHVHHQASTKSKTTVALLMAAVLSCILQYRLLQNNLLSTAEEQ